MGVVEVSRRGQPETPWCESVRCSQYDSRMSYNQKPATQPLNAHDERMFGGGESLLLACNERLTTPSLPLATPKDDPRLLLQRALVYGAITGGTLHMMKWQATPAHRLPLIRAFFEQAACLLWASRGRWDRYWSWHAAQVLEFNRKHAEVFGVVDKPDVTMQTLKDTAPGMPGGLPDILEQIDTDDQADPVFARTLPWDDTSKDWARKTNLTILRGQLHLASHGNPISLYAHLQDNESLREGMLFLIAVVWLVRAVHVQCNWPQAPVLWAYQWITRGNIDPNDHGDTEQGSYGKLGLPEL